MKRQQRWLVLLVIVIGSLQSKNMKAGDLQQNYIGKAACGPDFRGRVGNFHIRLDKSQNSYLYAHTLKEGAPDKMNVLLIVQFKDDSDHCGIIKDVVRARDTAHYFEFNCEDPDDPSAVVIGTWSARNNASYGRAAEAWKANLQDLRFIPIVGSVACDRRESESGSDDGDDLASHARRRSLKHSPKTRRE